MQEHRENRVSTEIKIFLLVNVMIELIQYLFMKYVVLKIIELNVILINFRHS